MTTIPLLNGAYTARGLAASAQRCVNLYLERNPEGSEEPTAHYPRPGLTLRGMVAIDSPFRDLYLATNGSLYGAVGTNIYLINAAYTFTLLGTIDPGVSPVSMVDNGNTLVIVDGTTKGYTVDLATNAFAQIVDVNFFGADRVDYIDTFLVFNLPGTKEFYSSLSNSVTFDPTYIAAKTGFPDKLVSLIVMHREIWLIGELTTEVWYNSGAAAFPFAIIPGVYGEWGCTAKYSVAKYNLQVFWLSITRDGQGKLVMGVPYSIGAISNYAVEQEWAKYPNLTDAIGMIYQQNGHVFYVIVFPTANKTWAYDLGTKQWHEMTYTDDNGQELRHRANCMAFAFGKNLCGDWQNGNLYSMDASVYEDNGQPIVYRRGFLQITNDGKRVAYNSFIADLQCGNILDGSMDPTIYLRYSDDRGQSWGNPIGQSMGKTGNYLAQPQWNRLGVSRGRVFELFWSEPTFTMLAGAYIDTTPWGS